MLTHSSIGTVMKHSTALPIPVRRALRKLGSDIKDGRKRRRITMELMAERANITRSTLSKIEEGAPSVSMGRYASVLFSLGMIDQLKGMVDANNDLVGRRLEEEHLPKRVRPPKNNRYRKDNEH